MTKPREEFSKHEKQVVREMFADDPQFQPRRTDTALAWGQLFKNVVMIVGQLAVIGLAILSFVKGSWLFGLLLLLFVGVPVWLFVSDIVTGLIIAPLVGLGYLRDRRHGRV